MIDAPVIETARLRLRAPRPEDFEAEAAFYATDRSAYVGGPLDREQTWRMFATFAGHWVLRGFGMFAVEDKETGAYLGRAGHWSPEGWPEPELGWILTSPAAEGRGLAHEAALAMREHAYQTLGWSTLISVINRANARSIALAEKLGAAYERPFEHPRFENIGIWRHPGPAPQAGAA